MKRLILLTDYKGNFGSHWGATTYRSGMDISVLKKHFANADYQLEVYTFSEFANLNSEFREVPVIYTSSEDIGYHYKDFIEDVILFAQEGGALVIPRFAHLRANNNKVFMELLLKNLRGSLQTGPYARVYGVFEEAEREQRKYPAVIKEPRGAMSRGVQKADDKKSFARYAKRISRTPHLKSDVKDHLRTFKHKGYQSESLYRNKFVSQEFIPGLQNDWKVLIYGHKYFIFSRPVRPGDFRASGSGFMNYTFGSACEFPEGIFDFAEKVYQHLEVPQLSLDIAFDGQSFYLIEIQSVFFGTVGVIKSDVYFQRDGKEWKEQPKQHPLERLYAESIISYLNN